MDWAIPGVLPAKRALTVGSAFGSGIINGMVLRRNPTAGLVLIIGTAIVGASIAAFGKGVMAEVAEGAAAGSVGALGLALPLLWGGGVATRPGAALPEQLAAAARAAASRMQIGARGTGVVKKEFQGIELI